MSAACGSSAGCAPTGSSRRSTRTPNITRAARAAFTAAGITGSRTRLITGRAADVLPRLADDSYDVVFVDGPVIDQPRYITEGLRLLRSGGLLLVHDATADGRIADPSRTDPETEAARQGRC